VPRIDPTDIAGINERARTWAADGEPVSPIDIGHIIIGESVIDALADLTRSLGGGGPTLMVADRTPMSRRGDDLKSLVESALGHVAAVAVRRLPDDPDAEFHADLTTAQRLADELPGYAAVVSVGSGSITDVAKYARHLALGESSASLPFISFPTAASVTAFTSALAVLTVDGVKRTLGSRPPDAVVCDLQTLTDAPPLMTRAGFGDVLARSVAYGDWLLAGQLGMDDGFSHVPSRLLEPAEQAMIAAAEQVAGSEAAGVRAVTEAVLLAGMAMSIVNQTAPVSGWEHVISHFLDLTAAHDGRAAALHGGQVGVATLIAARAYERAWDQLDLDLLAAETTDADVAARRRTVEAVFTKYDATGRMAAEIWRDLEQKLNRWCTARAARGEFVDRKRAGEFDGFLCTAVRRGAEIDDALRRAAAPRRFAEVNEPIPASAAHAAVRFGHLIRTRFTLGDLLDQTGWLTDETAGALLDEPQLL